MTASIPAVLPAPLHYRGLQRMRNYLLKRHRSYDTGEALSRDSITYLDWWLDHLQSQNGRSISSPAASLVLETDAPREGGEPAFRAPKSYLPGPWTPEEAQFHINWLELRVAFLALRAFAKDLREIHIQLFMDSRVAIAYINQMGGTHSQGLCNLAVHIWTWCLERTLTIHAEHLPGKLNVTADFHSRYATDSSDWKLDPSVFQQVNKIFGCLTIDLFAATWNAQLLLFFSWKLDPEATAVDALAQPWADHSPYAFPPFALVGRCLQKLCREEVKFAVVIAPVWRAQHWFPVLLSLLVYLPLALTDHPHLLNCQQDPHPLVLNSHLHLAAWPVSGVPSQREAFQKRLVTSSVPHGGRAPTRATMLHGTNGPAGAINRIFVPFQHL